METEINNSLPIPSCCDNCCSVNIELRKNNYLNFWYCNDCFSSVSCHIGTTNPLGRMADIETRKLRAEAHKQFDPIWLNEYMTRTRAYNWIAVLLKTEPINCHISWLSKDQLKEMIKFCSEYLKENKKALKRRMVKRNAKEIERTERKRKEIKWRKAKR